MRNERVDVQGHHGWKIADNRRPSVTGVVVRALHDLPNHPLDCDAHSRFGSTGELLRW
jgi:hypothetical protein